jgi:CRISPR system Cascade subunit CasE
MTHLAQVTLDFATAARLGLRDCYDWHQKVWKAFPGRDGERRDFLTRLDQRREGFRLLIVSPTQPERPEWCPPDPESWKTKPIPETYFTRRRYAFQLCANPTKKVSKELPDGSLTKNGRRVPLRKREELVDWIKRKGDQGGFAVDEATLRTFSRGREYFKKNGQDGLHSAVEFQGVLAVTDPAKFHETFTGGIGSAKAFGFGLLVIAPVA